MLKTSKLTKNSFTTVYQFLPKPFTIDIDLLSIFPKNGIRPSCKPSAYWLNFPRYRVAFDEVGRNVGVREGRAYGTRVQRDQDGEMVQVGMREA